MATCGHVSTSNQSFALYFEFVRKQPIIALYFEFENELKFYNLEARSSTAHWCRMANAPSYLDTSNLATLCSYCRNIDVGGKRDLRFYSAFPISTFQIYTHGRVFILAPVHSRNLMAKVYTWVCIGTL